MYIDTHCHLDSSHYDSNLEYIISDSKNLGVEKIIIPGASIADLPKAIKIAESFENIYFAAGIHPSEIHTLTLDSIDLIKKALKHEKCVAVGEIGLDYHYLESNANEIKQIQENGFRAQIELALQTNKPIIIHTRDSNIDIIRILQDYYFSKGIIFHCFGGDMGLVDVLKCEVYYGIGGVLSFKNAQTLQQNIKNIPLDSIILETDAPYLAPTPHRGKTNTPQYIPLIASYVAKYLDCDIEKVASFSTKNASRAFGF